MRIKDFAKQVQHARKNGTYAMLNQASFQEHAEGYKFHNIAPPHKRDTCPYCIVSHSCQYQKDFSPHCSKPSKHEPSECAPESEDPTKEPYCYKCANPLYDCICGDENLCSPTEEKKDLEREEDMTDREKFEAILIKYIAFNDLSPKTEWKFLGDNRPMFDEMVFLLTKTKEDMIEEIEKWLDVRNKGYGWIELKSKLLKKGRGG